MFAKFTHDNGVIIQVPPEHEFSHKIAARDLNEVAFKKIVTKCYELGIIDRRRGVIDLGAWIGDNALPWAVNIVGTVHAIDPSPENCNFMRQVVRMNDIRNLVVIEKAISKGDEILSYHWGLHHTSFSSEGTHRNKMSSTSLDRLREKGEISDVGMIHLDVEGMEFDVIRGAHSIISKDKPIIFYEQHIESDDYKGLAAHLNGLGYTSNIINETLVGCNPDCRNLMAVPKERVAVFDRIASELGRPDLFLYVG